MIWSTNAEKLNNSNEPAKSFAWWTASAVVIAIIGNVVAALIPVLTLLRMPTGSSGRPMFEVGIAFVVAAGTFGIVLVLAIIALLKEKHRILAFVSICLALTPFFFASWVMNRVAQIRHIFLEP